MQSLQDTRARFAAFWDQLQAILRRSPSTATVFNQYLDCNDEVDLPAASSIRTANLRSYMERTTETASILVVGEAPGPWGTRFSGVPFTGERQLLDPSFPFAGEQSSKSVPQRRTKISPPYMSQTAGMFWEVMLPYCATFFAWNAFPLHPDQLGDSLAKRNPSSREVSQSREAGEALCLVKAYVRPNLIVAVGRKAEGAVKALGEVPEYVRHPSMGGKAGFAAGMQRLFGSSQVRA